MIQDTGRIHGFDALRGIAMLLGIVLHAIIPYMIHPVAGWPNDTALSSSMLEALYHFIHSFRMELFFFVAGYFAHFSLVRNGVKKFIDNRKKRVLIPFIVSLFILLPFCYLSFRYYSVMVQEPGWSSGEVLAVAVKQSLRWNGLVHLWFLYYLAAFYVALILIRNYIPDAWQNYLRVQQPLATVIMIPLIAVVLLGMPALPVQVSTSLFPPPALLMYYFLFFMWGYLNYSKVTPTVGKKQAALILLGLGVLAQFAKHFIGTDSRLFMALLTSIGTVCLVSGAVIGFLLAFTRDTPAFRYLADASYWMYLVHVPIVVALHIALLNHLNGPALSWLKPLLVMGITILVTLLSYQYFVRYTIIGEYLHGKRKNA